MSGPREHKLTLQDAPGSSPKVYKRDFWSEENLKFSKPHFRLEKCAHIVNEIAGGRECRLLDVGCGPAALRQVLHPSIHYYGIDIAIQQPAPNLLEADLLESPISFEGRRFEIVVAQGFFEYMANTQEQKLTEIRDVLTPGGKFVASYVNFGHRDRELYWPYSNVRTQGDFRASLERHFTIERCFPTSHNWRHSEPNRRFMRVSQMPMRVNVPVISPLLAVEYFFICSPLPDGIAKDLDT